MITYIVRLVCIVTFTFVGIVVCTAINEGLIELLGVVGLIGSGILMAWESFRLFQRDTDRLIDDEYMSDEWLQRLHDGERYAEWLDSQEASRIKF
jgi:hypothetical protein